MEITGQAPISPEIYRSAVRHLSKQNFLRIRLVGLMVTVAGVLALVLQLGMDPIGIGFIAGGLVSATLTPFQILRKSLRQAAPAMTRPWSYTIKEDGITVDTGLAATDWRWASITRAEEFPQYWLLRTTMKNHGVILLKQAFSAADQLAVAQELQRRKLAPEAAPALVA